jgi:hypothetical protein
MLLTFKYRYMHRYSTIAVWGSPSQHYYTWRHRVFTGKMVPWFMDGTELPRTTMQTKRQRRLRGKRRWGRRPPNSPQLILARDPQQAGSRLSRRVRGPIRRPTRQVRQRPRRRRRKISGGRRSRQPLPARLR